MKKLYKKINFHQNVILVMKFLNLKGHWENILNFFITDKTILSVGSINISQFTFLDFKFWKDILLPFTSIWPSWLSLEQSFFSDLHDPRTIKDHLDRQLAGGRMGAPLHTRLLYFVLIFSVCTFERSLFQATPMLFCLYCYIGNVK